MLCFFMNNYKREEDDQLPRLKPGENMSRLYQLPVMVLFPASSLSTKMRYY